MVRYPTSKDGWPDGLDLRQIERGTAAQVLALIATESLAYGRRVPRESHRKLAEVALAAFGNDAVFLSNSAGWGSGGAVGGSVKLTNATFDAGLIAYDADNALIYWVEDED
jgi:hypothetical protein